MFSEGQSILPDELESGPSQIEATEVIAMTPEQQEAHDQLASENAERISEAQGVTRGGLDSLQQLIQAEQTEYNEFKEARETQGSVTQLELADLREELDEDIEGIQAFASLESEFPDTYEHAKNLLISSQVSDEQRELLYDLLANNKDSVVSYFHLYNFGEMFPDADGLQDFLLDSADYVNASEISEVLDYDIANQSEDELKYSQKKIENLLQGESVTGANRAILQQKITEVQKLLATITQAELTETEGENDALIEENDALIEENDALIEENEIAEEANVEVKSKEIEEEKMRVENISGIKKFHNHLIEHNFPISSELHTLLSRLDENSTIEEVQELQSEVRKQLSSNSGEELRTILTYAQLAGGETLRQTQDFLTSIGGEDSEFQSLVQSVEVELGLIEGIHLSEIRQRQSEVFFGTDADMSSVIIDGDVMQLDDMFIDTSSKPPRASIQSTSNELSLDLDMPRLPGDSETNALRREYSQDQLRLQDEMNTALSDYNEASSKLARLEELENKTDLTPNEQQELTALQEQKTFLESQQLQAQETIRDIQEQAVDITQAFEQALQKVNFDQGQVETSKERARFVLKMMETLGLNHIGQQALEQIIAEIQAGMIQIDLGNGKTFDAQKIDLANGQFGETVGDPGGINFRENLVRFTNLLYYGNPDGQNSEGQQIGFDESKYESITDINKIPGQSMGLRSQMIESGVITKVGGVNLERARRNLRGE